jgi:hypothetical protein
MLQLTNPFLLGGSLAFVVFFGILAALASGRHIGKRAYARYGKAELASTASLETAVFGCSGC